MTAKYGIPGRAYADFATLRGDPSDGLPGVAGVGDKTAAALITQVRLAAGAARGARRRRHGDARRCADASSTRRATTSRSPRGGRGGPDVPLPAYDDLIPALPRDPDRLRRAVAERWGLDSPLNRVLNAFAAVQNA